MNIVRKITAFLGFLLGGFLAAIIIYFIFKFGISGGWRVDLVTYTVATITMFSLLLIVIGLPVPLFVIGGILLWRNSATGNILMIFAATYLLFWSSVIFVLILVNLLSMQEGSGDIFHGTFPSLTIFAGVQLVIIILSLLTLVFKQKKNAGRP